MGTSTVLVPKIFDLELQLDEAPRWVPAMDQRDAITALLRP